MLPDYTAAEYGDKKVLREKLKRERMIELMGEGQRYYVEYTFIDYTSIEGVRIPYHVKGGMTLERNINTQIPDEDQAIEW